jgi:hypothetical protein
MWAAATAACPVPTATLEPKLISKSYAAFVERAHPFVVLDMVVEGPFDSHVECTSKAAESFRPRILPNIARVGAQHSSRNLRDQGMRGARSHARPNRSGCLATRPGTGIEISISARHPCGIIAGDRGCNAIHRRYLSELQVIQAAALFGF